MIASTDIVKHIYVDSSVMVCLRMPKIEFPRPLHENDVKGVFYNGQIKLKKTWFLNT